MNPMKREDQKRLIFDISDLTQSGGSMTGISRVMREFATWAHSHRKDVEFVAYDRDLVNFRLLRPELIASLLVGRIVIDLSRLRRRTAGRRRLKDLVPDPFRGVALWLLDPRRRTVVALEPIRLSAGKALAWWLNRFQFFVAPRRLRKRMQGPQGQRNSLLPHDRVFGSPYNPASGDVIVICGRVEQRALQRLSDQGARIAVLCHDIIPILFPEFFSRKAATDFRRYFDHIIRIADLVLFASRTNETDARKYCEASNQKIAKTALVKFGSNLRPSNSEIYSLPSGLETQRYALFVSTIEPRKGHRLLFNVWKRLLAEGVPQAHRFKMVFVGQRGWLMRDFLAELESHSSYGDSLFHISSASDDALAALYSEAAFCLNPSNYEGYGLPVTEAFSYGKALLASTGGALPETVNNLSPCLDPHDEDVWHNMIKLWIEEPAARQAYELAIRQRYRLVTWEEAAKDFFRTIDHALERSGGG